MAEEKVSIERLREVWSYCKETGVIRWRVNHSRKSRAGKLVGTPLWNRYIKVTLNGNQLHAHRVAWAMETGNWPAHDIDHIDGDRANNKWLNLREATRSENMQNLRAPFPSNKAGLLGAHKLSKKHKLPWCSRIKVGKKSVYLGSFETPEAAHAAYLSAKVKFHPFQTLVPQGVTA